MTSQSVSFGTMLFVSIAVMSSHALGGTAAISTGPNSSVDGYLQIAPDDYGAWADVTFGGSGDLFNPLGFGLAPTAFTSGFFLFLPGQQQRELLTDNNNWQQVFGPDATLSRAVTSLLVASDTNGDGVDDRLVSGFEVTGIGVNLQFDLTQKVQSVGGGVSFLRQDYTVTNNLSTAISFDMVRAFDGDLVWDGDFSNDEVGTTMHGAGLGAYVFQQEAAAPGVTAVTLSGLLGGDYYGGKNGVTPGGGPPSYGFGTDTQVWDAYGLPTSWLSHVAGVGYNTNGLSGTNPPGSINPPDAGMGLNFSLDLAALGSTTITVFHTYGQNAPVPAPGALALLGLAGLSGSLRRRCR